MANRWGNDGNSDRLYFGGCEITADGDFCHEIKRRLFPGRKAMTNLDRILKSRHIILPPKVCAVKATSKTVGVARGHQRADTLKPQSQKTSQSDHMDHSLV